ncbi:MAG: FAD-dependent thymidylate synthase [Candidatus Omnitrophota bacterium]
MKVYLAGYNVDSSVLQELQEKGGHRDDVTPEVLSAAYARISRDPRPINEIRKDARSEVNRARKSNSSIIFKMGHHSVAEHAIFNLDILEISRLAMEEVEKFRLCSYTEKSQRYVTLDRDFVIPQEIKNTPTEKQFTALIHEQNEAYTRLFDSLKEYVFKKNSALAADPKNHSLLEGWAKEDARYITSLATQSQVGLTINARNLELMLRRFASSELAEVRDLGKTIHAQIAEIAPSIVLFYEANDRDRYTYPELRATIKSTQTTCVHKPLYHEAKEVSLVEYSKDGDIRVAASLLHSVTNLSYLECKRIIKKMSPKKLQTLFKAACKHMQFYDSMLREFEYAHLTFEIILSAACFGQLKRHRMSTITAQSYEPQLGVTIPLSIKEVGMEKYFKEIIKKTNRTYDAIRKKIPQTAAYILTNAHRRRVLMRINARELYHISRLREDSHAQWDIRAVSKAMSLQAKTVMPYTFALAAGKDAYNEAYKNLFGTLPKITQAVLPSARKIK